MESESKYTEKRFDIDAEAAVDIKVLETIPFHYPGTATDVVYETEEFTCVCPWTGLPDFGKLIIRYLPDKSLIELKSLKYYLLSYRNVGIIQEHAVNHILEDLIRLISPITLSVSAEYRERGGIRSVVTANYNRSE